MPKYTFLCDDEKGGCGNSFEIECLMSEYTPDQTCLKCKIKKPVIRSYQSDLPSYVCDSSPKTLGALADRNTSKMSEDERQFIHKKNTAYKNSEPLAPLPDGMTRTRGTYN